MKRILTIILLFLTTIIEAQQPKNMKTALILIDIQNDYFENGKMELSEPEIASQNAGKILQKFRTEKSPVIHIQHKSTRPDASFFIPGTNGVNIHKSVKPKEGEKIITKLPNSFRETDLLKTLKDLGIDRVVICGMMTHMCVDATTRAAKDFGFDCIVIGDACATKKLEINGEKVKASEVQKSFLSALNYFYANVINTDEYFTK